MTRWRRWLNLEETQICHRCEKREAMPGDSLCVFCEDMKYEARCADAEEKEREREVREEFYENQEVYRDH